MTSGGAECRDVSCGNYALLKLCLMRAGGLEP